MNGPLLVDRSDRLRMTFAGDKAKEALGGLLTNDVKVMAAGAGLRAAALTPKGRVIALTRVFDRGGDLLVDCEAAAAEGFAAMIRKYVNPRLSKYSVITDSTGCVGVYGSGAEALISGEVGADRATLERLAPFSGQSIGEGDTAVFLARSADLSEPGFDLIGGRDRIAALTASFVGAGARVASPEEVQVMRVEAGIPAWGVEMDAETIPQEAVLDDLGAISFDKGCYTGQEIVARIHFRGHVNRQLRWLTSKTPLAVGARVFDGEGKEVGEVRSSVVSPRRGPLAIAMIRREVEPGGEVRVRREDDEVPARVQRITSPA